MTEAGGIRVMLLDDHDSFRVPLAFMLEREPEMSVAAQAGTLAEANRLIKDGLVPDVAVVDLDLPDGSGTEFVAELTSREPDAMVLVLSAFSDKSMLARAIESGAAGVLHKSSRIDEIVDAVRQLHFGRQLVSPQEVMDAVRLVSRERRRDRETQGKVDNLTVREREVLQALAEGLGDKEIAERLTLSVGTVRSHVARILEKLEVRSRLQALVFALRAGVVKTD